MYLCKEIFALTSIAPNLKMLIKKHANKKINVNPPSLPPSLLPSLPVSFGVNKLRRLENKS